MPSMIITAKQPRSLYQMSHYHVIYSDIRVCLILHGKDVDMQFVR